MAEHITPGPEQRSVWDFPRPPVIEPEDREVRVVLFGRTIAESSSALRVLETSHPPGIYLPVTDILPGVLTPNPATTMCEWKGRAVYWDAVIGRRVAEAVGWSYPEPRSGFTAIAGSVSFYPGRVDACYLGGERVLSQEGGFYGGWITSDVVGPFKGGPGTMSW